MEGKLWPRLQTENRTWGGGGYSDSKYLHGVSNEYTQEQENEKIMCASPAGESGEREESTRAETLGGGYRTS
jgi:hypothetical protein